MQQWRESLAETRAVGKPSTDRTGTGTVRQFGVISRFDLTRGFPLEGTKFTSFKSIRAELLWMIKGLTNIRYLKEHGVSIWDEWIDPKTAVIQPMTCKEVIQASLKKDGFSLEVALQKLSEATEKVFSGTIIWLPEGSIGVNNPNYIEVNIPRSTLDDQANDIEKLAALMEKMVNGCYCKNEIIELGGFAGNYLDWQERIASWHLDVDMDLWPFNIIDGDLGPVYGKQWVRRSPYVDLQELVSRIEQGIEGGSLGSALDALAEVKEFMGEHKPINQLADAIELLKKDPTSRRIMVDAWNPAEREKMALPPCHYAFQFFSEELTVDERFQAACYHYPNFLQDWETECSLNAMEPLMRPDRVALMDTYSIPKRGLRCMVQMRSNDAYLGEPFNIAQYGILTHMAAQVTDHMPIELIMVRGDYHIYQNHLDVVDKVLALPDQELPRLKLNPGITNLFDFGIDDIEIVNYKHGPRLPAPVAV